MGSIQLKKIEKWFGDVQVIKGIDLDVADGQFVVFVGPSGCGKSTLLRMIAGLEDTSRGQILLNGEDVTAEPPSGRQLSMVFQSYALYPHMSVRENMGFGLKTAGATQEVIKEKVDQVSKILQLDEYLDRKPKDLSGGQRQRVAIGRAIVREPKGFLFDEPLSNLDAALRAEMRFEIAKLHDSLKTTMIYVTHDQVEAMTLADKIVVLKSGLVMQIGSPIQLYEDPDNLFVAEFIGSPKMNIMPCTLDQGSFTIAGHGSGACHLETSSSSTGKLGIRPEQITIVPREEGHCFGTVEFAEYLGADTILYVVCEGLDKITVRATGKEHVEQGSKVGLKFDENAIFFFDENNQRLRCTAQEPCVG